MYWINTENGGFKPDTCIWLKADVRGIYPTYNTIEGGFLRELLRT